MLTLPQTMTEVSNFAPVDHRSGKKAGRIKRRKIRKKNWERIFKG